MKIDNTYFDLKVKLRLDAIKDNDNFNVLDCYSGEGRIWNTINASKNFNIVRLDKKNIDGCIQIDNKKYLQNNDLNLFNYIDLDAYGICNTQIGIICNKGYKGVVFFYYD